MPPVFHFSYGSKLRKEIYGLYIICLLLPEQITTYLKTLQKHKYIFKSEGHSFQRLRHGSFYNPEVFIFYTYYILKFIGNQFLQLRFLFKIYLLACYSYTGVTL
jgi:hypothetical protein